MRAPHLQIRGLKKKFGKNVALEGVDLDFEPGEFVGLMGPNGAGKSTLIKILDGVHDATEGEIRLDGAVVPSLAGHPEVAFIHQDLGLVDGLSIAENLQLGQRPLRLAGTVLDRAGERRHAVRALDEVGLHLDPRSLVGQLSAGEKALVAVARAFSRGASLLFVDETTSTLPPGEAGRVIAALTELASRGATIIMVTHKLAEVLDATNRVVVLLDGRLATDRATAGLDRAALVSLLVQAEATREADSSGVAGDVVLELRGARTSRIGPVDLVLRAGEVLGVSGLPGSGLHDVGYLVHGSIKPASGEVWTAKPGTVVSLVPPHRESQGGFNDLSIRENMSISSLVHRRNRLGLLSRGRESAATGELARRLDLRPADVEGRFGALSGGNKQKAIFARALLQDPDVLVLCEPTRGVDVGTRSHIYELIRRLSREGRSVLVVSSDAEDLFSVCDSVGIVTGGRVSPIKAVAELTTAEMERMV